MGDLEVARRSGCSPARLDTIVRPPVCRLLENCMLLTSGELAEVLIAEPWIKTVGERGPSALFVRSGRRYRHGALELRAWSGRRVAGVAADSAMFVSI